MGNIKRNILAHVMDGLSFFSFFSYLLAIIREERLFTIQIDTFPSESISKTRKELNSTEIILILRLSLMTSYRTYQHVGYHQWAQQQSQQLSLKISINLAYLSKIIIDQVLKCHMHFEKYFKKLQNVKLERSFYIFLIAMTYRKLQMIYRLRNNINQLLMIQQIATAILILLAYLIYACWIRPYKTIKGYAKQLRDLNYKVLEVPYRPTKIGILDTYRKGISEGDALKAFKQQRSKYDVYVGNVLNTPRLEFYHPDFHKQIYGVDKHYDFPKAERVVQIFQRVAGHGLVFSQGQQWHRKRRILNKIFNFDFIKSQAGKIASICSQSIKKLEALGQRNQAENSVTYSISDLTVEMFSCITMEIFLGGTQKQVIDGKSAGDFIKGLMSDITNQALDPVSSILGPKFTRLGVTSRQRKIINKIKILKNWGLTFIRKRISEINHKIQANIKSDNPQDIIEALIMAKNNDKSQESIYSEQQIFEEFITFFMAGTDTTSNFTEMMIYLIAKHKQVESKLRQEIQSHMKTDDYSYENLKNMTYLDMVQKQVTRYYGPGTQTFSRMAKKDNYLNGLKVKKGTSIGIFYTPSHYNQKYFQNPNEFRPQRWESECDNLPNFVFQGFGGGARTCIGKHLAMLESKVAVIKFFKRYKEIEPKKQIKMVFKFLYSPEQFKSKMYINQNK